MESLPAITTPPLRWRWLPWPHSHKLALPVKKFTSNLGISGLALVRGRRLDILVVYADQPGRGQCRAFVAACKRRYDTITVWSVWSPILEAALLRWSFTVIEEWHFHPDSQYEFAKGYRWTRPTG